MGAGLASAPGLGRRRWAIGGRSGESGNGAAGFVMDADGQVDAAGVGVDGASAVRGDDPDRRPIHLTDSIIPARMPTASGVCRIDAGGWRFAANLGLDDIGIAGRPGGGFGDDVGVALLSLRLNSTRAAASPAAATA